VSLLLMCEYRLWSLSWVKSDSTKSRFVSFEAFTAVIIEVEVSCVATPCNVAIRYQFYSMDIWNAGILPQHYVASKPRRPWLKFRFVSFIKHHSSARLMKDIWLRITSVSNRFHITIIQKSNCHASICIMESSCSAAWNWNPDFK
jgi:hypothetical protein